MASSNIDQLIIDSIVSLLSADIDIVGKSGTSAATGGALIDSEGYVFPDSMIGNIIFNTTDGTSDTVSSITNGNTRLITAGNESLPYQMTWTGAPNYLILGTGVTSIPEIKGFTEELKASVLPVIAVEVEEFEGFIGNIQLAQNATVAIHAITSQDTDQDSVQARLLRSYVIAAMCSTSTRDTLNQTGNGLHIYENQALRFDGIESNDDENENGKFFVKTALFKITCTTV